MPSPSRTEFTVSSRTLFKIVLFGLFVYLLYTIFDILLLLFVALIFASLIDPFANWFEKRRIPRGLAVLVIYIILFGIVGLTLALLVPLLVEQGREVLAQLGPAWAHIRDTVASFQAVTARYGILNNVGEELLRLPQAFQSVGGVVGTAARFFGGIFSTVLVMVITFYMVVEDNAIRHAVRAVAPPKYLPYISTLMNKMQIKLGAWLRGQLLLSLIVGALVFTGLAILDVRYALLLALFAGLFEVIPYVGPVLATIPAIFLAFTQTGSLTKPLLVLALFMVIQQLENHIIVPKVMQKAVGLNPLISISALLIGFKLAGIPGALLAIPVAAAVTVVLEDVFKESEDGG